MIAALSNYNGMSHRQFIDITKNSPSKRTDLKRMPNKIWAPSIIKRLEQSKHRAESIVGLRNPT